VATVTGLCERARRLWRASVGPAGWGARRRAIQAQGRWQDWQARQQSSSLCAAANAAAWALVHACHGAGGSEGTRLLLAG
jgi:hypothetical protein